MHAQHHFLSLKHLHRYVCLPISFSLSISSINLICLFSLSCSFLSIIIIIPPDFIVYSSYYTPNIYRKGERDFPLLNKTSVYSAVSAHLSTNIYCRWFDWIISSKTCITEASLVTYHLTKLICFKIAQRICADVLADLFNCSS